MNVSLTPRLEKLVIDKVASGRYGSASEVVREALRLLEEQDSSRRIRALQAAVAAGVADLGAGTRAFDEAMVERIKTRGRKRLARQKRS
jgi:antitoxin ParD1/3/4